MWQISYPLRMVLVRVIISWQKCNFSLKHLNEYLMIKKVWYLSKMTFFEAKMGEKGIIKWGCVDFIFKLNLLPPYSLCSQGINRQLTAVSDVYLNVL